MPFNGAYWCVCAVSQCSQQWLVLLYKKNIAREDFCTAIKPQRMTLFALDHVVTNLGLMFQLLFDCGKVSLL